MENPSARLADIRGGAAELERLAQQEAAQRLAEQRATQQAQTTSFVGPIVVEACL